MEKRVITEKELKNYAEAGLTRLETAKKLEVQESTIIYYSHKYKITFKREVQKILNKPTPEELYELYIIKNLTSTDIATIYGVKVKTVQRWCEAAKLKKDKKTIGENKYRGLLKAHGGKHPMDIDSYKVLTNTPESIAKAKKTCQEKYGVDAYVALTHVNDMSHTPESKAKARKTCQEKYGVDYTCMLVADLGNSKESRKKAHETKKKNGSYTNSLSENKVFEILTTIYPEVIRQYQDERYPFPCDFYIPSEDLFIEYNGYFTHGKEPYDPSNPEHIDFVNYWKQQALDNPKGHGSHVLRTFVKNDPLKRQLVKEQNLNWKEFFSIKEVEEYFGKK